MYQKLQKHLCFHLRTITALKASRSSYLCSWIRLRCILRGRRMRNSRCVAVGAVCILIAASVVRCTLVVVCVSTRIVSVTPSLLCKRSTLLFQLRPHFLQRGCLTRAACGFGVPQSRADLGICVRDRSLPFFPVPFHSPSFLSHFLSLLFPSLFPYYSLPFPLRRRPLLTSKMVWWSAVNYPSGIRVGARVENEFCAL